MQSLLQKPLQNFQDLIENNTLLSLEETIRLSTFFVENIIHLLTVTFSKTFRLGAHDKPCFTRLCINKISWTFLEKLQDLRLASLDRLEYFIRS